MRYIAFLTRGLETICKRELVSIDGLTILSVQSKYIRFEYSGNPITLGKLRTVDDIGILLNEFPTSELVDENFQKVFNLEKIKSELIPFINGFRNIKNNFSITVSSYKSENLDKVRLKESLQKFLSSNLNLNLTYTELDHSNLDFRTNIEKDQVFLSLKLFSTSLYYRSYNHETMLGSLRPTIAGAMIFEILSSLKKSIYEIKMVDNLCGSGTFLCEGYLMNLQVFGGDLKQPAVDLAKKNLKKAGLKDIEVYLQEAGKTRWQDCYFDIAVSNFPWNKQVSEYHLSKLYESSIKEYSRILKKDGSVGLIGMKPDLIKKYIKQFFPKHVIEEYRIGYLGQTPTIIFASNN